MEVGITCASSLHNSSWIVAEKGKARGKPNGFFRFSKSFQQTPNQIIFKSKEFQCRGKNLSKFVNFQLSCYSYEHTQVPAEESETNHASIDEALVLKKKSHDVAPYLSGHCIYLVGMMGSGKTTVGKILAEVLGYSFFDSDKLVEQSVGAASVAQIFRENSENFFRNKESEVLQGLSFMSRLVVATGGGAVIEEKNWNYMKTGITVWLDVPLEALARRVAAVGTDSRPLLCRKSGDAYTNALGDLSEISKKRGAKYANANARVCLENVASKLDFGDISDLTPSAIAIEKKSQGVAPHLSGHCIYLVGMMGSGKTTVGKILAEVLGHSFLDSDKLVEQAVSAASVAQIFRENSEDFFRNKEALEDLSEISKKRGAKNVNANTRVCLESMDLWDILDLTPTAIAIEALVQIEDFLKERWTTSLMNGRRSNGCFVAP